MSDKSSSTQQKTVSLLSLSGTKRDYAIWIRRFNTYATLKKFNEALEEAFVLPTDLSNLTTTGDALEKEQKAVIANNLAVACLTMSFTKPEDLEYVDDSSTTEYTNGVAREVMKALSKEYRPKDRLSAVEAETKMRSVKLKKNENPDRYFKRLGVVKSKWKKSKTFTEEEMIAHKL